MARRRSDDALVAGVRAGDDLSFEALYDRYHRNLLGFCHHMLGSREEAEDVLQHTFLAAYRTLRAGDEAIHIKPWLYTVARNRCLSVLRGRRDAIALDEGFPGTEGLVAEVDRRADLRALVRDVQRLPPDQRAALLLFELGDHSQDEIAAVLDVRVLKVKALLFQARAALMGWRAARELPCAEVRQQLATLTGSARRRGPLRRHVEQCEGCAEYESEVQRQRAALAIALPVVPATGLKLAVLGSVLGGSSVAAGAGAGAAGLATKVLVAAVIAGGAGTTGYVAVEQVQGHRETAPARHERASRAGRTAPVALAAGTAPISASSAMPAAKQATVSEKARAHGKARRGRGRALGTKAPRGKAAAPGQLKSPGAPARGKALGAAKAKKRPAKSSSAAKRAHGRVKAKPRKVAATKQAHRRVKPKPRKVAATKRAPGKRRKAVAPTAGRAPGHDHTRDKDTPQR